MQGLKAKNPKLSTSLLDATRVLYRTRSRVITVESISQATGLTGPWLHKFGMNMIKQPNVDYIQTLYEFLSQKTLQL